MKSVVKIRDVLAEKISGEWGDEPQAGEGVSILRTTNFTNDGFLNLKSVVKREIRPELVAKKRLKYGDIIIEKSGGSPTQPVGRVVFFDIESSEPYLCNNFTAVLRPSSKIHPKYLLYALLHKYANHGTLKFQNKTTGIINLKLESYLDEEISLPPLPEQQRIASILERLDSARLQRRQAAVLAETFLRALFLERFGDPVANPKKWKRVTIVEIVTGIVSGWSIGGDYREKKPGEFGVLKISAVTKGKFDAKEYKVVKQDDIQKALIHPKKGDVLFSRANTRELVAATCIVDADYPDLFLPDKLWRIDLDLAVVNPCYFQHVLSHPQYRSEITKKATGSSGSMLNISQGKLLEMPFPLPPLAKQEAFAATVATVDKLRAQQLQSTETLEQLFQSAIHRAFSGEELFVAPQRIAPAKSAVHIISLPQWRVQAGLTALLMEAHGGTEHQKKMGRVKIEKTNHLAEAAFGLDLGRAPRREAAGPADFPLLLDVENRAAALGFYSAHSRPDLAQAYEYRSGPQFAKLLAEIKSYLGDRLPAVQQLIQAVLPLTKAQIECAATAYAAWNDLLQANQPATDAAIIRECRQNWTPNKASYSADEFHAGIHWLRTNQLVPTGQAKRTVAAPIQGSLFS